jgi:2-phosphoglycerate kinase
MILIRDKEHSVPFVREMLVESLTRAGMKPWHAHMFSKEVEDELLGRAVEEIGSDEFSELVHNRLMEVNEKIARRFKVWKELKSAERDPIIVLLGGGTGVGTTTVGTELAHRLGIKNIISTDSIREVMRKTVSDRLLPSLHSSSFDAYKHLKVPISKQKEAVIAGFQLQASAVSVGVEAIIERALKEGTPTLIEGLHVVPGFINQELCDKHNVMMFVLHLKSEKEHKNRLYSRAFETKFKRAIDGYLENFKSIRHIQNYITDKAKENKVQILENSEVEDSIVNITDTVIEKIIKETKKEE